MSGKLGESREGGEVKGYGIFLKMIWGRGVLQSQWFSPQVGDRQ